jgi:hypothetical protein
MILEIFKELSGLPGGKSPRALQKELLEFFVALEPSGFLVCLGIRRTVGSQDISLPPERQQLISGFTRLHTILTEEERLRNPTNPSLLTVGARAMQKHASRSSEGFWGQQDGLTEKSRNE